MSREVSLSVRVEDYLTEDDIEELLRDAIRDEARSQLRNRFERTDGATLVWYMARAAVEDILGEKCKDMERQLEDNLRKVIGELSVYWVFGSSSKACLDSKKEPTKAQRILDECCERLAPEIEAKARELWLDKLDKADAAEILSDAFYDIMAKVFRGEEK